MLPIKIIFDWHLHSWISTIIITTNVNRSLKQLAQHHKGTRPIKKLCPSSIILRNLRLREYWAQRMDRCDDYYCLCHHRSPTYTSFTKTKCRERWTISQAGSKQISVVLCKKMSPRALLSTARCVHGPMTIVDRGGRQRDRSQSFERSQGDRCCQIFSVSCDASSSDSVDQKDRRRSRRQFHITSESPSSIELQTWQTEQSTDGCSVAAGTRSHASDDNLGADLSRIINRACTRSQSTALKLAHVVHAVRIFQQIKLNTHR